MLSLHLCRYIRTITETYETKSGTDLGTGGFGTVQVCVTLRNAISLVYLRYVVLFAVLFVVMVVVTVGLLWLRW